MKGNICSCKYILFIGIPSYIIFILYWFSSSYINNKERTIFNFRRDTFMCIVGLEA